MVTSLQRSNPEAEGISSSAVLDFIHAVEQHAYPLDAVQGFMLMRHGKVVAEGWWTPYGPQFSHTLFSLSKSFTSSAIGLAVTEGLLSVDDPVLKFFPDDAPTNPSENLKAMRVRHLLSMNSGHDQDTYNGIRDGADTNWPRAFLSLPVEHVPGTWFRYNTGATYMCSAIITKLTGQSLLDYLRPRLFEPLGIDNPFWEADPRGISLGGTGLHIRLEDIAHFGQMYLQKGIWNGKRILSEAWIAEATSAHSDNSNTQTNPDWVVGYGYQFWRCRHDAYRGDGAFGQYCVVMPEQDAVLVINSGVRNLQLVLDRVWEHLLPAMQSNALPENPQAEGALRDKLASLSLPLTQGHASSAGAAQGWGQTYTLEPNDLKLESVALTSGDAGTKLSLRNDRGQYTIPVGYGTWLRGSAALRGQGDEPVAASGAWIAEDTYEARLANYESEYGMTVRFHYTSGNVHIAVEPNVSSDDNPPVTTITGHVGA